MMIVNKTYKYIVFFVVLILLIPLIAMHFSEEVKWTSMDFLVGGSLLLGTGLTIDLVFRIFKSVKQRIIICALILIMFLFIWAELAVGIL
jgi:hypothetical protein